MQQDEEPQTDNPDGGVMRNNELALITDGRPKVNELASAGGHCHNSKYCGHNSIVTGATRINEDAIRRSLFEKGLDVDEVKSFMQDVGHNPTILHCRTEVCVIGAREKLMPTSKAIKQKLDSIRRQKPKQDIVGQETMYAG